MLAGYGSRVLAAVVDLLVRVAFVAVPIFLAAFTVELAGIDDPDDIAIAVGAVLGGVVAFLVYAPLTMALRNGQTWGHSAARIRVVHQSGAAIGGGRAFCREVLAKAVVLEGIGAFFFGVVTLLNYLWPLWDDRNQALHDKMCDTLVVKA